MPGPQRGTCHTYQNQRPMHEPTSTRVCLCTTPMKYIKELQSLKAFLKISPTSLSTIESFFCKRDFFRVSCKFLFRLHMPQKGNITEIGSVLPLMRSKLKLQVQLSNLFDKSNIYVCVVRQF